MFSLDELQPKVMNLFSNERNNSCRVCDLCYMLIVAEHELIEVEQEFAKALNIPVSLDSPSQPLVSPFKKCTAESVGGSVMQWRLMFYIENIYVSNRYDYS